MVIFLLLIPSFHAVQCQSFTLTDTSFEIGAIYRPTQNIAYAIGKSKIDPSSLPALDQVVSFLQNHPNITIEISVHLDHRGSNEYSFRLDQQRANNVKNYFLTKGIKNGRLEARGYGATQPLVTKAQIQQLKTIEEQQRMHILNRRTEFKIRKIDDAFVPFNCTLSTPKTTYLIGERPKLNVCIRNKSGEDVYFIGSLDGSDGNLRYPQCDFSIDFPDHRSKRGYPRCGNTNPLRTKDFVLTPKNACFNPYQSVDGYGFFDSATIYDTSNFMTTGTYQITYEYSTKSRKISDYVGDGEATIELNQLFRQVPKIKLVSNPIVIEFIEP